MYVCLYDIVHFAMINTYVMFTRQVITYMRTMFVSYVHVHCRLEDPYSFPTTEIQKVERRHILLRSVVEQLKRRESTTVIAALAAGKSRLIKKWRATDNQ